MRCKVLPAFEHGSRWRSRNSTSPRGRANPLLDEFRPTERALSVAARARRKPFAPQFNGFLTALGPLTKAAKNGLPAVEAGDRSHACRCSKTSGRCCTTSTRSCSTLGEYVPEVQAFFANFAAATQAHLGNSNTEDQGPPLHYLRSMQIIGPESLAIYTKRIGINRANPYFQPGAFRALGNGGLQVFESRPCAPSAPSVSGPANETISEDLIEHLIKFHIANAPETPNSVPAPGCNQQGPFTLQRPDEPVPACDLRREVGQSGWRRTATYSGGGGPRRPQREERSSSITQRSRPARRPDDERWSIRCTGRAQAAWAECRF